MSRSFSTGLLAATLLGATLAAPAAWSFTINATPSSGLLVNNNFTDFTFNVGVAPLQEVTNVTLQLNSLSGPTDYLNQVEAYLLFDSQTLLLFQGLLGNQMTNTVFDDTAAGPIDLGTAPYTGSFQPQGVWFDPKQPPTIFTLAGFNGLDPNGTWTLRFYDLLADSDVGTFGGATLNLTATPVPVPPQFLATALGASIGALKLWRKSARKG